MSPRREDRPGGPVRVVALVLGVVALLVAVCFLAVDLVQALHP